MFPWHYRSPQVHPRKPVEKRLLLAAILTVAVALPVPPTPSLAQDAPRSPSDWVQHVAPGVRLVGRPNLSAQHFNLHLYTFSPDGRYVVGVRGRRLVEIEWDTQQVVRQMDLPTRASTSGIHRIFYTEDRRHLVVTVHWQGRPYAADDGTDLDDEDVMQSYKEYPPHKFRGTRLLIFDQQWALQHDLELVTQVDENHMQFMGRRSPNFFGKFDLLPDQRTLLAINGSLAKVIDLESGRVVAEQAKVSDGHLCSPHEYAFDYPLKIWDIQQNVIRSAESLQLPEEIALCAVAPNFRSLVYFDPATRETVWRDQQTGRRRVLAEEHPTGDGQFTTDGRLYLLTKSVPEKRELGHMVIQVHDTVKDEVRMDLTSETSLSLGFRPGHDSLLVHSRNDGGLTEVALDQDFLPAAIQATMRLPSAGGLAYFDRDRQLFLMEGHCQLSTDAAATLKAGMSHRRHFSPTKPLQLTLGYARQEHEVGLDSPQGDNPRKLYKIAPLQMLHTLRATLGLPIQWQEPLTSVLLEFDPTGEIVRDMYVENQKIVRLRLTQTGTGRRFSETRLLSGLSDLRQLSGAISPDGRRAALTKQQELEVLDAKTGKPMQTWELPQNIRQIKLDQRGEFVAVALGHYFWNASIKQVRIFRVSDGQEVLVLDRPGIVEFGFQPGTDRLYVLTSGDENELRFFDRDTWQETWRHSTLHAPAYGMAMSTTGHEIAIGLRDSRVEFWKLSEVKSNSR
ncbi:MAG: hypothetical protein Q8M16_04170 [Pirellulaceae bacterium]|nr:hypothetical protein [Pirellulaceae bacterium]